MRMSKFTHKPQISICVEEIGIEESSSEGTLDAFLDTLEERRLGVIHKTITTVTADGKVPGYRYLTTGKVVKI